jgi:hypothetical protein
VGSAGGELELGFVRGVCPIVDVVVAIAPGVYYSSLHTLSPLGQILGPAPARS